MKLHNRKANWAMIDVLAEFGNQRGLREIAILVSQHNKLITKFNFTVDLDDLNLNTR